MLVKVEDKSRIKDVKFKYPRIHGEGAIEEVKHLYNDMMETEHQLDDARDLVRTLENELHEKRELFYDLQNVMSLEFEEIDTEHVDVVKSNMAVINPSDASNRSYTGQ